MKTVTKDRDSARANVDRLATKLTAAEQAVIARRSEAQQLALDGADDAALDKAEAALRGALDRQSTICAASAEAAKLVVLLETRLAEMHDKELRNKTAAEVEAMALNLETAAESFDVAITELAEVSERAKRYCIDAVGLVSFASLAQTQVPDATAMICAMLRAHAVGLLAPALIPPPQNIVLFAMKPIKWMADGRQHLASRFTDVQLPAGLAAFALRSGACCTIDDARRRQNHGAAVIGSPAAADCFELDAAGPAAAAAQPQPYRAAFEPIERSFTVVDRGPAVPMKVARNAS